MSVTLNWVDNNPNEESHLIYRSVTPIDPDNLPPPVGEVGADTTTFEDFTVIEGVKCYYRVGSKKGNLILVSEQIEITP